MYVYPERTGHIKEAMAKQLHAELFWQKGGELMEDKRRARIEASMKYNAENVKQVKLGLNRKTDADIIAALAAVPNVQGYIKRLIRKDMTE